MFEQVGLRGACMWGKGAAVWEQVGARGRMWARLACVLVSMWCFVMSQKRLCSACKRVRMFRTGLCWCV